MALTHMLTSDDPRARCREDPEQMFVKGKAQHEAKKVCAPCLLRTACLADALDNRIEFGVWGGKTERERRALLRRRKDVTSWSDLLQRAQRTHESAAMEMSGQR